MDERKGDTMNDGKYDENANHRFIINIGGVDQMKEYSQQKAIQLYQSIVDAAEAIKNGLPAYISSLPPKRKNIFSKMWYYFSDRKKRKGAAAKIAIIPVMAAAQIMAILSQPIPKHEKGSV